MRPFRVFRWACALWLTSLAAGPAQAAWDSVFQACCHNCQPPRSVSAYAPAACCPQPVCTTQYVQRSYYQPVTSYQTRTYYEPVTSYRTSYYYEPVTSYRYSCYYDPCTCSYQQVATPVTSYRLRSQCCPVQSWTARCVQVPVTSYQVSYYWQPVTTCCSTTEAAYPPAVAPAPPCTPSTTPGVTEQPSQSQKTPAPPSVTEQRSSPPPPAVNEQRNGTYDRYYPVPQDPKSGTSGSSHRQLPPLNPGQPRLTQPVPPKPAPVVRLDRIVSLPGQPAILGQVIHGDNRPRAGAKLLFVSTTRQGTEQNATSDESGQFRVALPSGGWLVYVAGADGKPVFHSKIEVRANDNRQITLVSR